MFSPFTNLFSRRNSDGPPGQAPHTERAQSNAPDASPPQTVDGPACTPLSNQGATTATTEVIRSAHSPLDRIKLSESDSQKIQEAFDYLHDGASQGAVSPDVPVALNIISTMLRGTITAQVTFPDEDPEEAFAHSLYLRSLVGSSLDGADFARKLQHSKLLTTRTPSPHPPTPRLGTPSPTDERASPVPMASSLVLVIASTKARLIEDFPPTWYNNACGSSTIIENAPWESVVHASPTTHKDLNQALPVNVLSKLFAATVKDGHESGEYTKTRATILMTLGQYFCSAVYSSAIAGSMLSTAVQVGHRRALDIVLAAVQHIPLLEGAATLARRASVQGGTEDVLTEFVAALDGNLIPNESDQYLKWHSLVPAPGESSRQFLTRLVTAAATISKTEEDIVNQFRMGIDQSVKTGSSVAQSVRSDTRACKTLSELNKERASNRSLYDMPLIAAPRRAPISPTPTLLSGTPGAPAGAGTFHQDGLNLLNKPMRQAYDVALFAAKTKEFYGSAMSPTIQPIAAYGQPPVEWRDCAFCIILKLSVIPYPDQGGPPPPGKVYCHNYWRCPRAERAVEAFREQHPTVSKEELLRPIDNLSHQVCLECIAAAKL